MFVIGGFQVLYQNILSTSRKSTILDHIQSLSEQIWPPSLLILTLAINKKDESVTYIKKSSI